jgi:hypothetical protein
MDRSRPLLSLTTGCLSFQTGTVPRLQPNWKLQVLDLGFEITDTGFEIAEIDLILEEARDEKSDSAGQEIDVDRIEAVARRGDL